MTVTPEEKELDAFAQRMRLALSALPAPPQPHIEGAKRQGRRADARRRLVAAAAGALVLALGLGTLAVTGRLPGSPGTMLPGHQRSSGVWSGHGLTIRANSVAAQLSCRLPVSVLATGQSGFIDFSNNGPSFVPAAAAAKGRLTYIPAFHDWVDVLPQMVSPSRDAYVTKGESQTAPASVQIVHANGTTTTWPVPPMSGAFGWSSAGVILGRLVVESAQPAGFEVSLLDPLTGSIRPFSLAPAMLLRGGGSLGFLPADDSLWSQTVQAGSTTVVSQSVATGAVQTWYQGPGTAYVVAATSEGDPIIQVGTSDLGHLQPNQQNGVSQQTLLFTSPGQSTVLNQGVVGQPNVAADLSPLSATMGNTVWMADVQGGIWRWTAASGMREVARITTSNDGPPGISISGACG